MTRTLVFLLNKHNFNTQRKIISKFYLNIFIEFVSEKIVYFQAQKEEMKYRFKINCKRYLEVQRQICFFQYNFPIKLQSLPLNQGMTFPNNLHQPKINKKTHQIYYQPHNLNLLFENPSFNSIDQSSPASNQPSELNMTFWQSQFNSRSVLNEKYEENLTTVQFQPQKVKIVRNSIEKYWETVSQYLKVSLKKETDHRVDFLSTKQFKFLDIQKQQFSQLLEKYNQSQRFGQQGFQFFQSENSVLRVFTQQVTYLNYDQINFELIWIFVQMYSFKNGQILEKMGVYQFLEDMSQNQNLKFLSLKFLQEENTHVEYETNFLNFLEKLFGIFSDLYLHYTLFQSSSNEEKNSNSLRGELKLFSSKRDIWDSEDEDEEICFKIPSKRIKFV